MATELRELLRFHAVLGGSAVVLSATLTRAQRALLAAAWADGLAGGGRAVTFRGALPLASVAYPLATVVARQRFAEQPLEPAPWSRRAVRTRLVHAVDDALTHVLDATARGGAVAWVRNTVDDCLDAAARLRARGLDVLVFHARFAQGDRQAREAEVLARFGKEAPATARAGRVLVATQVIEQSLDLDFDAMVSDLAPADLLVQRAGRLWRHASRTAAGRPVGDGPELVVLAPPPLLEPPEGWLGGAFRGTARVYADAGVLWRTARALSEAGAIVTPDGLRGLIEAAYDEEAPLPASLVVHAQRARGQQGAQAATANFGVLKAPDGYHADAVGWVDDLRMPTRLGDERTTVRLARVGSDGVLAPWVADTSPWKAWALSEVSVRAYRVPAGSRPDAAHAEAVARLRAGWGRFAQEVPVLPLAHDGEAHWRGTLTTPTGKVSVFTYDGDTGLAFGERGPAPSI